MEVIEEMQRFVQKIANNEHETVKPGQSVRFTEACTDGDRIWQGGFLRDNRYRLLPDGLE